jgi:hypothetical protein
VLAAAAFSLNGALKWLHEAIATAVALVISADPPDSVPPPVKQRLLTPENVLAAVPGEALLAPTALSRLLGSSLRTPLATEWATVIEPLLLLLLCHPVVARDPAVSSDPPTQAPNLSSCEADICSCAGQLLAARQFGATGAATAIIALNAMLPPLQPSLTSAVATGLADWAEPAALCVTSDPTFQRLLKSAVTTAQARGTLNLLACSLTPPTIPSEPSPSVPAPSVALAAVHHAAGLPVLSRAVAAAVSWVLCSRAAIVRAQLSGEPWLLCTQRREEERALLLLHSAVHALCALVTDLLHCVDMAERAVAEAHLRSRWRLVCHTLLSAYHILICSPACLLVRHHAPLGRIPACTHRP